jgi:glutamine amidotransferase
MGWNVVAPAQSSPMFDEIEQPQFYFLHSFHVSYRESTDVAATCTYAGVRFTAATVRDNIWAAQFHPEKSHRFGMQLFRNFAAA